MKAYEESRSRTFDEGWRVGKEGRKREWLHFDPETKQMKCTACAKYALGASRRMKWITGTDHLKLDSIVKHEQSDVHAYSVKCLKNSKREAADSEASACLSLLTAVQNKNVSRLIRNAHALAKHSAPFIQFEWMCRWVKLTFVSFACRSICGLRLLACWLHFLRTLL